MSNSANDLGPNAGLVEDMYRRFQENPQSIAPAWQEFFADYQPRAIVAAPAAPNASSSINVLEGETATALKGPAKSIAKNMEASLTVPTATSVRTIPAKLLEINRQILNNHLGRSGGGKVSFTHVIAFAVLRALEVTPGMNSSYGLVDGEPAIVRHHHVNLGLAIDQQKKDGSRTLLVPNLKSADTLNFAQLHAAYEDLLRRVRTNKITPDDFAGTTVSLTNPGMIGTVHSVPRLMPGQGVIVGVGSIDYPPEFQGADPSVIARVGVSKVVTITSTYDHRVIQGAESGEFLRAIHRNLLGEDGFYDDIFHSLAVPYEPARWLQDSQPMDDTTAIAEKAIHVQQIINMYRVRGHLIANLDPLGRKEPKTHPELDINHWGLSIWDLDREFPTGGVGGQRLMALRDVLKLLRDAYARTIGVEYMHIQEHDEKTWIQARVEGVSYETTVDEKQQILFSLNAAEAFEKFLHTKYLGQKRFSLEGAETLIPMVEFLLAEASAVGIDEVVLGMAHRGRLNVLANLVGKSYGQIFREFEGELDPDSAQGSGDVKYHLGASGQYTTHTGKAITVTMAANPSHLEAVDPVVEGMVRAKQDRNHDDAHGSVLSVLVHGDAAFAGQGVVAETLNLSELPGYDVGGTVHIVVNNQLGFTTAPTFARSTVHCTDIAKGVQAPIFHVNGYDPEAAIRVIRLAFAFRQRWKKDVVVDMVCYRRYGHNEGDEPGFTQPRMYELIRARRSVRKLYTEVLVNRGDLTVEDCERALEDYQHKLEHAFAETHDGSAAADWFEIEPERRIAANVETGVARETLDRVVTALTTFPDDFTVHPKLKRILEARRTSFETDQIDWATAEALAFGTLLLEGTPVRLAGQDSRRGTFSQRHATLVDFNTENEYTPLAHLDPNQAPFMVFDSLLSEYAALGFEYGYSVADRNALICWEAQFGDFSNVAQAIIDQFIVAAEDKWGQRSGLVMLLPHGFEGQGPEHSSARIERFLTLCAENNIRVAYPTTAASYFHLLRRQVRDAERKPLIVFTPKKYLRMSATYSSVSEFTTGSFAKTLADVAAPEASLVKRLVVCSGKFGHELIERRNQAGAPAAVLRVEQLYPIPTAELAATLLKYPNVESVVWAQEEPDNMGARIFAMDSMRAILPDRLDRWFVARAASASPASGSSKVHDAEQEELLTAAFTGL